jgi:hypothetical protein
MDYFNEDFHQAVVDPTADISASPEDLCIVDEMLKSGDNGDGVMEYMHHRGLTFA